MSFSRRRRGRARAAASSPILEPPSQGICVTACRLFRAPPAAVYGMISRIEHLPRWSRLWLRADPLERRGVQRSVRLRGFLAGLPVEAVVRTEVEPGRALRWRQAHGTLLHYAGALEIRPAEDGCEVRYTVELDPAIAMLDEAAVRLVAVEEAEHTLDRMKWSVESERVAEEIRLMKSRPAPAPAPAAEAESPPAPQHVGTEAAGAQELAQPRPPRRRRRRRSGRRAPEVTSA